MKRAEAERAFSSKFFADAFEETRKLAFSMDRDLTETVPGEITFQGTESRIGSALDEWTRRWGRPRGTCCRRW